MGRRRGGGREGERERGREGERGRKREGGGERERERDRNKGRRFASLVQKKYIIQMLTQNNNE